jgi:hypothetical protein
MSDYPSDQEGVDDAPAAVEGLETDTADDFDADLGDARKAGHVAPILPPA